jgi:hypothetical protein
MMQAVKYGPFIPYEYSATDFAFQTLRALVSATIPDYVSVILLCHSQNSLYSNKTNLLKLIDLPSLLSSIKSCNEGI